MLCWDADERAVSIERDPSLLLDVVAAQTAVFTRRDVARALHRFIDERVTFERILATVMQSPDLVTLRPETRDPLTDKVVAGALYSTRKTVAMEAEMATTAARLKAASGAGVAPDLVARAVASVEANGGNGAFKLAVEQIEAITHVSGPERIAAIVGIAGAGKSTALDAARRAWQLAGHRVVGAALAGKAAEGLERSAGIPSRTLASWQLAWSKERDELRAGDVFVLDEAGMVASRQMAELVATIDRAGAKLVLVGDAAQLQPIEAGAAFRAIVERIGAAELSEVRRQRAGWQQQATRDLARGDVGAALAAYRDHDAVVSIRHQDRDDRRHRRRLHARVSDAVSADGGASDDPGAHQR